MKTINTINGIPLHYARLTNHPYGTRGEQRQFKIDAQFLKTLEAAFEEVFLNCPLGKPEIITTAGILVNKPGMHGHGKAFDIDAIFWKDNSLVTSNFIHQKELYIGIECFLRKHFGIVLNNLYPNHHDHWHIDTSVVVDYNKGSKSETLFVQMSLRYIYEKPVIIDGIWGRQTRSYIEEVFSRLQIATPITTKTNYIKFLDLTGKIAFKLTEDKASPIALLDNLEAVIAQLPATQKQQVTEALNSFLDHGDTASWLTGLATHHDLDAVIDHVTMG